jgi:uncharacterized Zn-finger protein
MNDKIKDYEGRMNWNVWSDITSTPVYGDGIKSMNNYVIPTEDTIIKVTTETVKCERDHPAVWYSLAETGSAVCGYCNIKYVFADDSPHQHP